MRIEHLDGNGSEHHILTPSFRYPEQVLHFDSLFEMARFVDPNVPTGQGAWPSEYDEHRRNIENAPYLASRDSIRQREKPFNRASNLRDTLELAYHGWREGRDRLSDWNAALEREFRKRIAKSTFVHDLAGIEVDVPAMLAGEPEHMRDYQQAQTSARHVRVIVDMGVRCDACGSRHHDASPTPPEWLLARGAALVMLVRALIMANYQPTIIARTTTLYRGMHHPSATPSLWPSCYRKPFLRTIEVPVHTPSDILDIDRINFVLSHESFSRRMEFRVHEIVNLHDMRGRLQSSSQRRQTQEFVGNLPLGEGHMQHHQSQLGHGDLYIPSPSVLIDALHNMNNGIPRDERAGAYHPTASFRRPAHGEDDLGPFQDATTALTWVFTLLEDFGVEFA